MLGNGLFITGTDTGVGKTFISSLLSSFWSDDPRFRYFKPVQTGYEIDDDSHTVLHRGSLNADQVIPPVYRFTLPASPDRAARAEGVEIETQRILDCVREYKNNFILMEGAGGVEVPLNNNERLSDLMRHLNLPVLIVASTRLGTINHTLLTVEKVRSLGLHCVGVVLSGEEDEGLVTTLENQGVNVLAYIPTQNEASMDWSQLAADFSALKTTLELRLQPVAAAPSENHIWHPFTQHKVEKDFPKISKAFDATLLTDKGTPILDAISSWWVNLHGHGNREIAEAIAQQAATLEHVIFAGFTHEPAETFANRLLQEIRPINNQWGKVFFSDNGSTAVEVALKMAYQFHAIKGQPRSKFLALTHSYHGDTLGAMSVSERNGYHKYFLPLMMPVDFIDADDFSQLEELLPKMNEYAACIVEPLVQGASGMRMHSPNFLQTLQKYCQKSGVLFIADEIFTGFYRTGTFLASEQAGIQPDMVCLSKGITGGFLPLSVTVTTERIYEAFLSDKKAQAFLHGHSYTANPIACAAANASLNILKRIETRDKIKHISQKTEEHLTVLSKRHSQIKNVRHLGTIGALDITNDSDYFDIEISNRIAKTCMDKGVLVRPLGKTIYTVPPYCITPVELKRVYDVISEALGEIL
jgi:adenosylmethionine---8-amino-7-oxononanoate aminotransferase